MMLHIEIRCVAELFFVVFVLFFAFIIITISVSTL